MGELNKAEYADWQDIKIKFSGDNFAEMFYWIIETNGDPKQSLYHNLYIKLFDDNEVIKAAKAWYGELEVVCNG